MCMSGGGGGKGGGGSVPGLRWPHRRSAAGGFEPKLWLRQCAAFHPRTPASCSKKGLMCPASGCGHLAVTAQLTQATLLLVNFTAAYAAALLQGLCGRPSHHAGNTHGELGRGSGMP